MSDIRLPVLLGSDMTEAGQLHPTKASIQFKLTDVSEASLTLLPAEEISMHGMVNLYTARGFAGVFRRTSSNKLITNNNNYALRHTIDILQDSIWDDKTDYDGTVAGYLAAILAKQTHLINGVAPWVLGTVADSGTIKKSVDFDNLLDLLLDVPDEGGNYYLSYDQSTFPWVVNYLAKPNTVSSEFRLARNLERCTIKDNDSELCNRLILEVNVAGAEDSIVKVYNNAASQAIYGIICRTQDIDVNTEAEADAWGADFLARRAEPQLSIDIDGIVLAGKTGDPWDESRLADLVRVALKGYASTVEERCVAVTYGDVYGAPERITVSLANALPTFTNAVGDSNRAASKAAKTSRAGGRSSARKEDQFAKHFEILDDDGKILRQAGMQLDANGMLVYADDNVNMVGSRFNVQADQIGMVVGTNDGINYIKAGEIALSINNSGDAQAKIDADKVLIGRLSDEDLNSWAQDAIDGGGVFAKYLTVKRLTAEEIQTLLANIGDARIESMFVQNFNAYSGEFTGDLDVDGTLGSMTKVVAPEGEFSTLLIDGTDISNPIVTAEVDGNTLTLTNADGTTTTFSKATRLIGSWEDGTLEVAATQSNGGVTEEVATESFVTFPAYKVLGGENFGVSMSAWAHGQAYTDQWLAEMHLESQPDGANSKTVAATPDGVWLATISNADTYNSGVSGGWSLARQQVSVPQTAGTAASFTVKVPAYVQGGQDTHTYTLQQSPYNNNMVLCKTAAGTVVARVNHGKYTAGYNAGWGKAAAMGSAPSTSGTGQYITVSYPPTTVDGAKIERKYYVTGSNTSDIAYIRLNSPSGITVAQINHGAYTQGKADGAGGVSHSMSCTTNASHQSGSTSTGGRKSAGALSASALTSRSYIFFTISCGGSPQGFYITLN